MIWKLQEVKVKMLIHHKWHHTCCSIYAIRSTQNGKIGLSAYFDLIVTLHVFLAFVMFNKPCHMSLSSQPLNMYATQIEPLMHMVF